MHRKFMVIQSVTWSLNTTRENLVQTMQTLCQWLIHYITLTLDTIHFIYTMLRWLCLLLFSDYWAIYLRWHKLNTFLYATLSITYDTSMFADFSTYARLNTSYIADKATHIPSDMHHKPMANQKNITPTEPRIHPKLYINWNVSRLQPRYFCTLLVMKTNETHYFSNLFDKVFYKFRTGPLSIIRSISTLYTCNSYL